MTSRALLLATTLAAACATPAALAQAPLQFRNTPEAVRLYEESTLETLRTKCETKKATGYFGREELTGIRNGYMVAYESRKVPGEYSVFAYDQDKRSFILLDGQKLGRGARLTLKLALPRDYSYCRIVRDQEGLEQLEVIRRENNALTDSQAFDRLLKDASELSRDLAGLPAKMCAQAEPLTDRVVVNGKALEFPPCHDTALSLRDRMDKLVRRVHER